MAKSHPVVTPPSDETEARPCRCGHDVLAHEHYRRGRDCALCACASYRRAGSLVGRIRSLDERRAEG